MEELERDRDTLLESYAGAVPEALENLEPEGRHRVYEMLRLRVVAHLDGTLEARGILSGSLRVVQENGRPVCTYGDVSSRIGARTHPSSFLRVPIGSWLIGRFGMAFRIGPEVGVDREGAAVSVPPPAGSPPRELAVAPMSLFP